MDNKYTLYTMKNILMEKKWDIRNLVHMSIQPKEERLLIINETYMPHWKDKAHCAFLFFYENSKLISTMHFDTLDEAFVFANKEAIPLMETDTSIFEIVKELEKRKDIKNN